MRSALPIQVTGNLQAIAWAKMEALGLKSLFSEPLFGGFGSDDRSRAKLVTIAKERAGVAVAVAAPMDHRLCKRYHFGDTPNDIKAAAVAGAVPVGVATVSGEGRGRAVERQREDDVGSVSKPEPKR